VTVTGSGEGAFTLASYSSDPVGAPTFRSSGEFFDVRVAPASSFTTLVVQDCNLNGGDALEYWTGSAWVAVSPESYSAGPPACVTASLSASSSPPLDALVGTVFAVVAPLPTTTTPPVPPVTAPSASSRPGYWEVTTGGDVYSYGSASFHGSTGAMVLAAPVVGMATDPVSGGYWLVGSDGGVFGFDAPFHGSLPMLPASVQPHVPVVGIAATPDGGGYWLVTSSGDVYSFGDATFFGSLGGMRLDQPIVGIAATPDGGGYWLVGQDGGVFSFGDANFEGSLPGLGIHVDDIVGITAGPAGGYWLVGRDGGVFSFGGASYYGSLPGMGLHVNDIVGISSTPKGNGYRLVGADGGIFDFGSAEFEGSLPGLPPSVQPHLPVVGMATAD
jgi:hypothetical protein